MAARSGTANAVPGSILLAIHDFVARSTDELSLAKGDRIELIERDDEFGDGWFLGKHLVTGNSGLFPEVYTTPAPKGTLSSAHRPRASDASTKPAQTTNPAVSALAASSKQQQQEQFADTASQAASSSNPTSTPSLPPQSAAAAAAAAHAQTPLASTALRASLPATASKAARNFTITSDSPVMSETLSVIDEHITDMKSPRNASYTNGNSKRDTISSVYSAQPPTVRASYIAGHETDEEEEEQQQAHTEAGVMSWAPARVAEYLEDHGVEKSHCDIFIEQEISGEVLLAMDQNSLFIKEFELGSVGRRLKTWHKIKALQDEVKRSASPEVARSVSEYSMVQDADETPPTEAGRNRSSTVGPPSLPRALTTKRTQSGDYSSGLKPSFPQSPQSPHISEMATSNVNKRESTGSLSGWQARPENVTRPSAQSVRNLNHSRRHSSIDSTSTDGASRTMQRKQPSIDQKWQFGQATSGRHGYTASVDSQFPKHSSSMISPASPGDLDRGYFSSNEVEGRSRRNVLSKRNSTGISPVHSRDSSILDAIVTPSRFTSTRNNEEPYANPSTTASNSSNAWNAVHRKLSDYRSATSTTPSARARFKSSPHTPAAPVVTKLDPDSRQPLSAIAGSPTKLEDNASEASSDKATPSPSGHNLGFFSQAKAKVTGLRSISDAITKEERTILPAKIGSPTHPSTGASTPSTENPSFDMTKSEFPSRESTGSGHNLMPPPPAKRRPRAKSKKFTSAYTRGLESKTPQASMQDCDYSGWMNKKSGSLMATWKTRLFILKGRRLSYYYQDDDTEEKGLIDISFHRVLPAQSETLTGVIASAMGAGASPTSPTLGSTRTLAQRDLDEHPPRDDDEGLFIFKLVPPKAGMAKGVHFTRPTVHYFAVNSKQEGRLWMAALMKATIDRDDTGVVTTTYNQKTVSLAKARARRERPPALRDDISEVHAELATGDEASETGLGIIHNEPAVAGAESEKDSQLESANSVAPSADTVEEAADIWSEKERDPVVLSNLSPPPPAA